MSRSISLALLILAAIAFGWVANDYLRSSMVNSQKDALVQPVAAATVQAGSEDLWPTALIVKQSDIHDRQLMTWRGRERTLIASFLIETSPIANTSIDLNSISIKIERDTGLVLRNPALEIDSYEYEVHAPIKGDDTWRFQQPSWHEVRYGSGSKLYAKLYASVEKYARVGVYKIPSQLTGWDIENQGKVVPFPGVVNGQPVVVMP